MDTKRIIRRPQFWNPVQRYDEKICKSVYVVYTRSVYVYTP